MKHWGTAAGSVFAVLIMAIVLYLYGGDLKKIDFATPDVVPKFAGSVIVYVSVMIVAAVGWRMTLKAFSLTPAPWAAERQMLISQIGKYVPGNVAQYLGRAAMAISSGIPAKTVAIALVGDTAAIVAGGLAAVILTGLFSPHVSMVLPNGLPNHSRLLWLGLAVAIFFLLLLSANLLPVFSARRFPKLLFRWLLVGLVLYTISFLLLGLSLHLIVSALAPGSVPVFLSVEIFAAGWVAGLITPGAPGGLGVRESVITLGLAPFLGGAAALSAALLHRGVSVLGDVISFGIGQLLPTEGVAGRT